jgi:hypothetical protein
LTFWGTIVATQFSWYPSEQKEFVESGLDYRYDLEDNGMEGTYLGLYMGYSTVKNWYELLPQMIMAKFSAKFIKKNGETREITCVFESTQHIHKGILTVFDTSKQDYRSINMDTLQEVEIGGILYTLDNIKRII